MTIVIVASIAWLAFVVAALVFMGADRIEVTPADIRAFDDERWRQMQEAITKLEQRRAVAAEARIVALRLRR